jgi:hypothetical protein
MYFVGGEMDFKRNQAKTRRMSHHLKDKNQQENKKELINAIL